MKRTLIIMLFYPLFATAQNKGSSEFTGWLGTHIYNHKRDVYSSFGQPIIDVKSAVCNSITGDYRRITKHNLLLHVGLEIGYEHFNGIINYPFEKYGYYRPSKLGEQYSLTATTLYGRVNLGIGHRFKIKDNNYDVLIGNMIQTPVTRQSQYAVNLETLAFGGDNYNFYKQAYFGKPYYANFAIDNISFFQLSTKVKWSHTSQRSANIGIRIQRSLLFPHGSLNSFVIEYYDDRGNLVGRDFYYDNQFAVSLMLGYVF